MADRFEKVVKHSAVPFTIDSIPNNPQRLSVLVSFVVNLTHLGKGNSVEDLP